MREAPERELQLLLAHPQPYLPRGVELGEPIEDRLDRAAHRRVSVQQDLAVVLAPDQADRQPRRSSPRLALLRAPPSSR